MSYQFATGFDEFGNGYTMVAGYPFDFVHGSFTTSTSKYRFAPPSGAVGGSVGITEGNWLRKNLSANLQTIIVGFAINMVALPSSTANDIFTTWDSGNLQVSLSVTANGALAIYADNGEAPGGGGQVNHTLLGQTANGTVTAGTWYGVMLQITHATGTGGSATLCLNGSEVLSVSGVNTAPDGNSYCNQVSIGNTLSAGFNTVYYDDFVCWSVDSTPPNTLPTTDYRIITKVPNANGGEIALTPNGQPQNYQNVSQMPPNVNDYNSSNTPGARDAYALPTAGLTMSPYVCIVRGSIWENDAQTHQPSLLIRLNGVDQVSPALPALTSSPLFYDYIVTGLTGVQADSAQIGIEVE